MNAPDILTVIEDVRVRSIARVNAAAEAGLYAEETRSVLDFLAAIRPRLVDAIDATESYPPWPPLVEWAGIGRKLLVENDRITLKLRRHLRRLTLDAERAAEIAAVGQEEYDRRFHERIEAQMREVIREGREQEARRQEARRRRKGGGGA